MNLYRAQRLMLWDKELQLVMGPSDAERAPQTPGTNLDRHVPGVRWVPACLSKHQTRSLVVQETHNPAICHGPAQ